MLRYFLSHLPPSPSPQSPPIPPQLTPFIGVAVRLWQLGIEMRPFFRKQELWVYPFFGGIGGSFGYWLQGVERKQMKILAERRKSLLEKRARRAEREGKTNGNGSNGAEEVVIV
jgi:hypothetical protein